MTLTQALESARRGDYEQAMSALAELGGRASDDPRVLDLLARVHAQRGALGDADECWSRVQSLDPADEAAVQGRRRIAALQAKRFRRRPVWPVAFVVAAGVGVVGILLPTSPPPAPPPPDISGLAAQHAELTRQLDAVRAQLNAEPPVVTLAKAVSSPAFVAIRQGDAVLVTFNDALFNRDARLSTSGAAAIAQLGTQLKPFSVSLVVTGHTDNRFRNPTELGFARAQTVADALGMPAVVRSAGATPLFPSRERAKNNTVTVLITPA
ncbi:hypothetical protein DMH04_31725 [Kibdelosporangium aridum]|uniref:OmpA-like domain-containing protein n=1 Tax=Kibdelosporangium aridum TaxID=2030 RepID=A0A428Z1Y3_KIBAR|nr:hypothetical protein [Kibdelosporangium aridum]RSM79324.1 hypothetical protein DMH04_31725 [Kibdelosporangium aridum]